MSTDVRKLLFNVDSSTYTSMMLCYVGARTIDKQITKSRLFMSLLNNSCTDSPVGVQDRKRMHYYSMRELYGIGLDIVSKYRDTEIDREYLLTIVQEADIKSIDSILDLI